MNFDERLARVVDLTHVLLAHKSQFQALAARELNFTYQDTAIEVDMAVDRLRMYAQVADTLRERRPLAGPDGRIAVMLSYNGSAWLNIIITSAFLVGNRVLVKFASRGSNLMDLTAKMYRPLFGDDVQFFVGSGRDFMTECLTNPGIAAGQTCTAPKRIFVHRDIYEDFLARLTERVQHLVVGPPEDERTQVSPLGSELAVTRIQEQLAEATAKGGKIILGGRIDGNLVYPTVIRDATDDMLGLQEESFGPMVFATVFDTMAEVVERACRHQYGLRAAVFGGEEARLTAAALKGEDYCHPVPGYTFGKFGTVALNETRLESWDGAFVTKPVGGYGYSGWIWETVDGRFRLKQGAKLITTETSLPG